MLVEIALKYENNIENKKTSGVSIVEKATAWTNIATEFNAVSVVKREASSLKRVCYRRSYAKIMLVGVVLHFCRRTRLT